MAMMLKFGSSNSALPAEDLELHDGVHLLALVGGDHRSGLVEEDELDPSSGVCPPHQSGLRSNVAPVCCVVRLELPGAGAVRLRVEGRPGGVVLRRDRASGR